MNNLKETRLALNDFLTTIITQFNVELSIKEEKAGVGCVYLYLNDSNAEYKRNSKKRACYYEQFNYTKHNDANIVKNINACLINVIDTNLALKSTLKILYNAVIEQFYYNEKTKGISNIETLKEFTTMIKVKQDGVLTSNTLNKLFN